MDQNQMMLDYLLKMGELQPEQEEMMRQRSMVDTLRQRGMQMPEMRGGGRGFQTAANPLEFLSTVASSAAAKYKEKDADQAAKDYKAKRLGAIGTLRDSTYGAPGATPPGAALPGAMPLRGAPQAPWAPQVKKPDLFQGGMLNTGP